MCFSIVIEFNLSNGRFKKPYGMAVSCFLRRVRCLFLAFIFDYIHKQPETDVTKHHSNKQFEVLGIWQVLDANPCTDKNPW